MLSATLGEFGMGYVAAVYVILFCVWLILGRIMHLTLKGYSPELIVEIPPYRIPSLKAWSNKPWFRIKDFLYEATPLVLLGIFLVNILDTLGVMDKLAVALSPIFQGFLGLPPETAVPIVMGLFRKDIAMGLHTHRPFRTADARGSGRAGDDFPLHCDFHNPVEGARLKKDAHELGR